MVIRPLRAGDFEAVHAAFTEAFSDYVIKLSPSRDQLAEMLARRAWAPEASVGVFDGERIVAFTLNGIDGGAGYDSGTGVVPSHRRQGLARELMESSFALLRERGCTRYILEVIDLNQAAAALYRSLGFVETRGLQCWSYELQGEGVNGARETAAACELEGDIVPSWQNTRASIARARDRRVTIGDEHGCAIVFPGSGDLPHLAVERAHRRRGIGTRLLRGAASLAGKPLRILNIDERDAGIAAFLERAGAKKTVRQLEMIRSL